VPSASLPPRPATPRTTAARATSTRIHWPVSKTSSVFRDARCSVKLAATEARKRARLARRARTAVAWLAFPTHRSPENRRCRPSSAAASAPVTEVLARRPPTAVRACHAWPSLDQREARAAVVARPRRRHLRTEAPSSTAKLRPMGNKLRPMGNRPRPRRPRPTPRRRLAARNTARSAR
jgi:hypothetical protein